MDKLKSEDESEEIVRVELEKFQRLLDGNNDTLSRCDLNRLTTLTDTLKAIDLLEVQYKWIANFGLLNHGFGYFGCFKVQLVTSKSAA